jgi:outer membrane protein TolC
MAKKFLIGFLLAGALSAGLAGAQEAARPMTLEQCLVRAMEKNLGLQVQVRNPELAGLEVSRAGEKFLPTLGFQYGKQNNRSASFSWIDSSSVIEARANSYTAGVTQLLPTGGSLRASFSGGMNDTNLKFQTINPYYNSSLAFTFSQPFLRDFGPSISRREILVARNNRDIADQTYKKALLDTLYTVEESYWQLVFSIENLKVMRQSLGLAEDLLARNKKELAIGMMAPIEVLSAESEVASRKADILQAEVLVKNRDDALRTLLNFTSKADTENRPIVPLEAPPTEKRTVSMDDALAQAMAGRPELQSARLALKNKDLDLVYARNQLLPDLSLQADYWSPAVSGTQILYQNGDPLTGVVVGTIPGGASQAMTDALKFKYKNWSVGLVLSVPLNTVFSRAAAVEASVGLEQAKIAQQDTEQQIFLEVRSAVRDVENNAQRVDAYAAARTLAGKKLEAEERKAKVGLSTNYTVLQVQRDLAAAQSLELQAKIDYVLSQARLDRSTGTSLDRRNIKWSPVPER